MTIVSNYLRTMGRYCDNIVNRDKSKTNYRDKKYSLLPKPNLENCNFNL